MLSPMRPLLQTSSSGSIANAAHCPAAGLSKRPFVTSSSTSLNSCPSRSASTRAYEPHAKPSRNAASASSASAVDSSSSTLAGMAVLAAQGHVHSYNSTASTPHTLAAPGSTVAPCVQEPFLRWDAAEPPCAHALDPDALISANGSTAIYQHSGRDESSALVRERVASHGAAAADTSNHVEPEHWPRPAFSPQYNDRPAVDAADLDEQPIASTSAPSPHVPHLPSTYDRRRTPARPSVTLNHSSSASRDPGSSPATGGSTSSNLLSAERDGRSRLGPTPASSPSRRAPARPRLRPPPAPLTWPDYPYARRPTASACRLSDEAGLKLEALFQSVLHYPRVPPKLLRFFQRSVPGGVDAQLQNVTATVERLSSLLGREVSVYLIRRSPWVVLVPAESIGPSLEAVRRLLYLQPAAVWTLLRKNPNLLRLQRQTLMYRYGALHEATGFSPEQVRALVIKYPLILNFQPESVESAATALRRLCSARPSWAAHHAQLSPSQFAFYMRDRVHTLLRLEYMLLTGSGSSWTLRDIIKTSNNMFKKTHAGFRGWMNERLRRLQQRLAEARREARTRAGDQELPPEVLAQVEQQAQMDYEREQQRRFHQAYLQRRQEEQADQERREEQRQRALEVKKLRQQEEQQRRQEEELALQRQESAAAQQRFQPFLLQLRQQQQQQQQQSLQRDSPEEVGDESTSDEDGEEGAALDQQQQQQRIGSGDAAGTSGQPAAPAAAAPPPPAGTSAASASAFAWAGKPRGPATRGPAPPSATAWVAGPPGFSRSASSPPGVFRGDLLTSVTPGKVWRRPGSKLPLAPPASSSVRQQLQEQGQACEGDKMEEAWGSGYDEGRAGR